MNSQILSNYKPEIDDSTSWLFDRDAYDEELDMINNAENGLEFDLEED